MFAFGKKITLLSILLLITLLTSAQVWEVKVTYDQDKEKLYLEATPDYTYHEAYQVIFHRDSSNQNRQDSIFVIDLSRRYLNDEVYMLELEPFHRKFGYEINLKNTTSVASKAYLDYGEIQLANWAEILFESNQDIRAHIQFVHGEQTFDLGVQDLNKWKENPSKILPSKVFLALNNISISTNVKHEDLRELLQESLHDFRYFDTAIELILLMSSDSLPYSGVFYEDVAIVYIDSKTSGETPQLKMKRALLHELFHGVSPYKIHPEIKTRQIGENWLSEAMPEYLSLKYLLQHEQLGEEEFLAIMEEKKMSAAQFSGLSLDEMSQEIYRNTNYMNAFYSKGCIAFWLLDLKLFEMTDGKITAFDLVQGLFNELDEQTQLQLNNVMADLEQELVFNEGKFPMNKYLESYGIVYERNMDLSSGTGEKQKETIVEKIRLNNMANSEQKLLWKRFTTE